MVCYNTATQLRNDDVQVTLTCANTDDELTMNTTSFINSDTRYLKSENSSPLLGMPSCQHTHTLVT